MVFASSTSLVLWVHALRVMRRINTTTIRHYGKIYYQAQPNELIDGSNDPFWGNNWNTACSDQFCT